MVFKQEIARLLSKETGLDEKELLLFIEIPPSPELGDYAFPCFTLSKRLKKSPADIARDVSSKIKSDSLERVECKGPYVNFFLSKEWVARKVLDAKKEKVSGKKEVVCIESPGPNTNKPLHLGHVRNMLLGVSIRNILEAQGKKVVSVDIVNDRGVHICKSMHAYMAEGKGKTPESEGVKGDFFVGDYYVKYAEMEKKDSSVEKKVRELLVKWEEGDPETIKVWKKMRDWCLDGFKKTYKDFGVKIDKTYHESDFYNDGKSIVLNGLKKGLFEKDDDGSVYVDLESKGLGRKVLLRGDGTSIYITQDIALGKIRFDDFKMDKMVYVVGNEQIYHFKVLFEVFRLLRFPFADKCYHLSYGMISLPEGKMKSREGTVVDADDFREKMIRLAGEEISKKHPGISDKEKMKRAEIIGMGAIKFFVLKYDPARDFVYNPKESLNFQGETGPYVQYTHARISSILRKAERENKKVKPENLSLEQEKRLLLKISHFDEMTSVAAESLRPSIITTYLTELSQEFNTYYHEIPVLKAESKEIVAARLALIKKVKETLSRGLGLLGIEAPEEM